MATITVTFLDKNYAVDYPDALSGLIVDTLATEYGYQVNIPNPAYNSLQPVSVDNSPVIANPDDKALYVVKKFVEQIVNRIKQKQVQAAVQAAQSAAQSAADESLTGVNVTPVV